MSRTPIRVALAHLENDGLVERSPRRGYFVTHISPRTLREIYEAREALETFACLSGGNRIEKSHLEKLIAVFNYFEDVESRLTHAGWALLYEAGQSLHKTIVHALGNSLISDWFDALEVHVLRAIGRARSVDANHVSTSSQHRAIAQALLTEDWHRAADLMSQHIVDGRSFVIEATAGPDPQRWAFGDIPEMNLVQAWIFSTEIGAHQIRDHIENALLTEKHTT